ncbi:MAG: DUF814 domain-containing protein [Chitinivibrionales bacterium]|nr:DUF814 domain-containing protein [Chitinivibrionales bacterium]
MNNQKDNVIAEIKRFRSIYNRAVKRSERKLEKQKEEARENSNWMYYRQIGDSLLALSQGEIKGKSEMSLSNVHTQEVITISLNPKLSLRNNAELYYKKSKKAHRGHKITEKNVEATEKDIEELRHFLNKIDQFMEQPETGDETFLEEIKTHAQSQGLIPRKGSSKAHEGANVPYHHFYTETWDIYVGKHASQNDELTTRFAKPRDLWLHVAAHAGSHVVIRRPKDAPYPPDDIIRKAAMLAVWFSKARHTSYAEVHLTETRYVRKPRKSPPGEVQISNYKSIRVEPKSPKELFSSGQDSTI